MRKFPKLKSILIFFVSFYLFMLVIIFFIQRSFLYFPPSDYRLPETYGLENVESLEITLENGDLCRVWWHSPMDETRPVVMVFHGNGSAHDTLPDIVGDLAAEGYGVLTAEYPGYPGCAGKPTQTAIVDAVTDQYRWIRAQNIDADRIVFYGTSLGTGVASQLSLTHTPRLMIVDAPFNSGTDMAQMRMPIFPARYLMRDTYRSDNALRGRDIPLLWIHGTKDMVVPFSQGEKLYNGYTGSKRFLTIPGGRHSNLWGLGGRESTIAFIEETFVQDADSQSLN